MDLKTKVALQVTKTDNDVSREYVFLMPYGSPIGEAYDVCHEVLQELVKMAENINKKAAQNKEKDGV